MIYNKLTLESFEQALKELDKIPSRPQYSLVTGVKGAKIFDLVMLNSIKPMPEDVFNLKYNAIQLNAYTHQGWSYFKYPSVSLRIRYSRAWTNEVFEEVDTDYYGDAICAYTGRKL